jgi:hypothetical protein
MVCSTVRFLSTVAVQQPTDWICSKSLKTYVRSAPARAVATAAIATAVCFERLQFVQSTDSIRRFGTQVLYDVSVCLHSQLAQGDSCRVTAEHVLPSLEYTYVQLSRGALDGLSTPASTTGTVLLY